MIIGCIWQSLTYIFNSFLLVRSLTSKLNSQSTNSVIISLHYYQLHKFNYLTSKQVEFKTFLNGLYMLLSSLNNIKQTDDAKLTHEYYLALILFLKFNMKSSKLSKLLMKYLLANLSSSNLSYSNHTVIINNSLFESYLFGDTMDSEQLRQKLFNSNQPTSINDCLSSAEVHISNFNEKYVISDYVFVKFQDMILHEMLKYLLNMKMINKTNTFTNLKILYIQLIRLNCNTNDNYNRKQQIQLILLQFLNVIYYWKLKKFNYKLKNMSKIMDCLANDSVNNRYYNLIIILSFILS